MDGEEKTYGGCEGPDAMYVKLISSDGREFIVKREHALTSGTIKAMLSGPGHFSICCGLTLCRGCSVSLSCCCCHWCHHHQCLKLQI
uniref:SKP1 component POZ domain-containing protein n=1 Tax=Pan paniscus TaxID=9597 RepID=A0A2R9AZ02_PANPA